MHPVVRTKTLALIIVVLIMGITIVNLLNPGTEPDDAGDQGSETEPTEPEEQEPEPAADRLSLIPEDAVKVIPETDPYPPVLHSPLWEDPVPMPYPINTAGAEDSPFITPSGEEFYFFFTPDPSVPAELQIVDGVTGIWYSKRADDGWEEAERVVLIEEGISLDGCQWVGDGEIWFCSVREGNLREIDLWIADIQDGVASDIRHGGERLNVEVGIGEFHVAAGGDEIYFHSDMPGGVGGRDIWVTRLVDGLWSDPENVEAVNTEGSDSLPCLTEDGSQLWFTRWYMGYPAIYVSRWSEGGWSEPEMIISQFAAEPTLDAEGNVYFAHHFIQDGVILDADIYVAYRRHVEPREEASIPERGYYLGLLPSPSLNQPLDEAYRKAAQSSEIVPIWGRPSPFYEMAGELSGWWGDAFVEGLARGNDLIPLIHFSFIDEGLTLKTPPGLEGATLSDPGWRLAYRNAILEAVLASEPLFLSVGNEVNRWYEEYGLDGPDGFHHFVSLYEEIYDAVKELSPETRVFCTFSREIVDENREADLGVFELFDPDRMDMLVITSYPHSLAGVNRPEDLPDNYYLKVAEIMPGKPFGFSEVVWPSLEAFGGEAGQALFVEQLVGRLTVDQGVDLRLLMWSWLTDLGEGDATGLIGWDGREKMAYEVWLSFSSGDG